jgi:hypothetical protein
MFACCSATNRHGPDREPGHDAGGQRQRLLPEPPDSTYFNVGRIGDDQLNDLAARAAPRAAELQRLLAPNL